MTSRTPWACFVLLLAVDPARGLDQTATTGAICVDTTQCSLNGDCVNGHCDCDIGWSAAPDCSQLALVPTPRESGYRNKSGISWGGYPIQDPSTKLWQLMVSEMQFGCSLSMWTQASAIVRAESAHPGGPYIHKEVVIPPFAHDATIRQATDGTYVIMGVGMMWNTKKPDCKKSQLNHPPGNKLWSPPLAQCQKNTKLDAVVSTLYAVVPGTVVVTSAESASHKSVIMYSLGAY
jgi:hypothetical protein